MRSTKAAAPVASRAPTEAEDVLSDENRAPYRPNSESRQVNWPQIKQRINASIASAKRADKKKYNTVDQARVIEAVIGAASKEQLALIAADRSYGPDLKKAAQERADRHKIDLTSYDVTAPAAPIELAAVDDAAPAAAIDAPPALPALAESAATRRINEIVVGERHRRDLGDIKGLAESIAELGLLQPIVVRLDGTLIAGERRLQAVKSLGWTDIPVNIIDLDAVVRGEFAENAIRKDFTLSESVAIKRALEPLEREAAKERQREGGRRGGEGSGKLPEASKGNAADKAAKATGMARRTLEKAEAVVAAAEAEPEKFSKLLGDMDRTGRVNGVFKRLKIARQAELIRAEPPPLPGQGPYRVIVADPPWPYEVRSEDPSHRASYTYPQMSIAAICALPVGAIAAQDAILWLWTTNHHMREAFAVLDAWRFQQKTILTWGKPQIGQGDWLRSQTEHCLMAVRGKPVVTVSNQSTLLCAPKRIRGHSVKPIEFYAFVESVCPAPRYADVFSRYRHHERWDCHGDEAPREAEPPVPREPEPQPAAEPPREAAPESPPLDIPPPLRRSRTTGTAP
jgi:N6-adenosine-specific RNA methylase IME4